MPSRIDGPSHRKLFAQVDDLDARMTAELHRIVAHIAPSLTMKSIVAAGLDEQPYAEPVPPVDWGGLSVIQSMWVEAVTYNFLPFIAQAYYDAANAVHASTIEVVPDLKDDLPAVTNVASETYLAQATNRMVNVSDRLWTVINEQLQEGVAKGESVAELKARLVASAGLTEPRAQTVARTEVISASNAGSLAQAKLGAEFGLEMQKEWLATEDARTRPTHHAADGQQVGIDDTFTVGGASLQFPGDPSGPPEEIINCRCTVTYVVADDETPQLTSKPKMAITAGGWSWNGLEHHTFCKNPLHPGPCKGAKKSVSGGAPGEAKHHHGGGGGGGAATKTKDEKKTAAAAKWAENVKKAEESGGSVSVTPGGGSGKHILTDAEKQQIYEDFKGHKGVSPAYSGKAIYESTQHAKMEATKKGISLSDDDVLSIADEQGTKMGHTAKAGPDAYKNKINEWGQTAAGQKVIKAHGGDLGEGSKIDHPHMQGPANEGAPALHAPSATAAPTLSYYEQHSQAIKDEFIQTSQGDMLKALVVYQGLDKTDTGHISEDDALGAIAQLTVDTGMSPHAAAYALDFEHLSEGFPGGPKTAGSFTSVANKHFPDGNVSVADLSGGVSSAVGGKAQAIDEQFGSVSHLSSSEMKKIHSDFSNAVVASAMENPDLSAGDLFAHAAEKTAAESGGKLTALQVLNASDSHEAFYGISTKPHYKQTAVDAIKANGALGTPPVPKTGAFSESVGGAPGSKTKKVKIDPADLPNGEYGATGYKTLSATVKMQLGTTADAHKIPYETQKAIKDDFILEVKKNTGQQFYMSSIDTDGQAWVDAMNTVAAKHGVSPAQVLKTYDKQVYGWGNKNKTEKAMYKHLKAASGASGIVKQGEVPDIAKLSPEKKAILGTSVYHELNDVQKSTLVQAMQQQGISAGSSNSQVFNSAVKVGTHLGVTPHDVLKAMDEVGSQKTGQPNLHHYETKGILHVKQTSAIYLSSAGASSTVYGGVIKTTSPHVLSFPQNKNAAHGTEFKIISGNEAQHMQDHEMGAFTPAEKAALKLYTSSYFKDINTYLRSGGSSSIGAAPNAKKVHDAMRPITQDLVLRRGASPAGFGLTDTKDLPSLVGKTYMDRGFLSTSVGGKAAFSGSVELTIHAPKGTHAAYVDQFSHYKGENELLLDAGTRYKVKSVTPPYSEGNTTSQWKVTVEIVTDEPNV